MSEQFEYIGDELEVFQYAKNWKKYWGQRIKPYLGQTILEVGAGIGGTTQVLCHPDYALWLGIEPDAKMVDDLNARLAKGEFAPNCQFRVATVQTLAPDELFDSILYIDVLEHIEHDRQEVMDAIQHLKPNGYLIVLSPAFQFLYTPFDEAIGHYRRYTSAMMRDLTPDTAKLADVFYLDAVGMLASMGNLLFLRASQPSRAQIGFWDSVLVPISRIFDRLVGYRFGRSVIAVWQRK